MADDVKWVYVLHYAGKELPIDEDAAGLVRYQLANADKLMMIDVPVVGAGKATLTIGPGIPVLVEQKEPGPFSF